jgi:4-hydroxyphenylpyruvate dioxygenase
MVTAQALADCHYADLVERFRLPVEELARLAALNILHDQNGRGGRFWQVDSQPFAGGLLFEIVQRTAGYDGYGAANAPFRIAVPKRLTRHPAVPRR